MLEAKAGRKVDKLARHGRGNGGWAAAKRPNASHERARRKAEGVRIKGLRQRCEERVIVARAGRKKSLVNRIAASLDEGV